MICQPARKVPNLAATCPHPKAFHQAIARREIIGVVSPNGIGFKFALKRFVEKHYLKVVYCNVRYSESTREVLVTLYRHLCNVKFSNMDYRKTTVFDLTRNLNERLRLGDNCLLCIDECSNLKPAQMEYFVQFLSDFNKPIGLVFRMNKYYATVLSRNRKFQNSYKRLIKVVDNWRVLSSCTAEEVMDITRCCGVQDQMILNDLVGASRLNLTILAKQVERIKQVRRTTT